MPLWLFLRSGLMPMPRCGSFSQSLRPLQFPTWISGLLVAASFVSCSARSTLASTKNSTAIIPGPLQFTQIRPDGLPPVCSVLSLEQILHVFTQTCGLDDWPPGRFGWEVGDDILPVQQVAEVSESTLTLVLDALQGGGAQVSRHVAVLYYAKWCPFSKQLRPLYDSLAALNPATLHVAIEDARMRRSFLTQVGVVSFPVLYIHNRTTRSKFEGSRTIAALQTFECTFTGVRDIVSQVEGETPLSFTIGDSGSQKPSSEPCPYSWIQHPEQLLHEHVWLLLATIFLSLRVLFCIVPFVTKHVGRMRNIATR